MPSNTGIETDPQANIDQSVQRDGSVLLENGPWLLTQVNLKDQSDGNAELLWERKWLLHPSEKGLEALGNLFAVENVRLGHGRIFVKNAPLPHARHALPRFDIRGVPEGRGFRLEFHEPELWSAIEFSGGVVGRASAFQSWQRAQRPATSSHKLPKLLCNTWGDRSRDSRIQETFVLKEIEAAVKLGAEVVQIDDGWQKGRSSNSALVQKGGGVWEGFWNVDPEFWAPDPVRFPNGLEPIVAAAKKAGVEIGLWFAPDSWNGFANWSKDAGRLLELHRELGICHFKIDGVNATTHVAYGRLRQLFDAIREGSKGEIVIDLDITAQLRPGHFGAMDVGPLFVENRYTDWPNYWPHQTLRALWTLSLWVDPLRLRMEFLNKERNQDKYSGDPLAPHLYPPETLFASVMFSNPLGWFEISNLPEEYFQKVAPLVTLWKSVRTELFNGTIIPVGETPDGVAWTGFLSLAKDMKSGFALAFRELNDEDEAIIKLPGLKGRSLKFKVLSGKGTMSSHGGSLNVSIPEKLGYVFGRFTVE